MEVLLVVKNNDPIFQCVAGRRISLPVLYEWVTGFRNHVSIGELMVGQQCAVMVENI